MPRVPGPVVFLGREDSLVLAHLRAVEPQVVALGPAEPLTVERLHELDASFGVSHGYRLLLREPVIARLPGRLVNLHISYLPYNRGAHPALWSVIDGTPAGVTIHHVDARFDTGDIIARERVELDDEWTLATAYDRLQAAMADLFARSWPAIRAGTAPRTPQPAAGTSHRVADYDAVAHLLPRGWDTRIGDVRAASARSPR